MRLPIRERKRATDRNKNWCHQTRYGLSPMVLKRSIPNAAFRAVAEKPLLNGPVIWRWCKFALFPQ
jgi:hypothetical protein